MISEVDKLALQAAIDGELDVAAEAELRQRLGDNSEASELEASLRGLSETLAADPEPEVPANLESYILQSVPLPVDHRAKTQVVTPLPTRKRPEWQGFAMAASLFVAVILGVGALFPDEINGDLAGQMTGTLLPSDAQVLGEARLDWQSVEADLQLLGTDDGDLALGLRADADQTTTFSFIDPVSGQSYAEVVVDGETAKQLPLPNPVSSVQVDVFQKGQLVHREVLQILDE